MFARITIGKSDIYYDECDEEAATPDCKFTSINFD
jgi:hypothetical protein